MDGRPILWTFVFVLAVNKPCLSSESDIYAFTARDIRGNDVPLSIYKGKVLLIVNVASECGYTDQHYKELVLLQNAFVRGDFRVLAFPCNQFGSQEPTRNSAIARFARDTYSVNFPMFSKIKVSGEDAHPLYKFLARTARDTAPEWNFYKYLVDRAGVVREVWPSRVSPMRLYGQIDQIVNRATHRNFEPFSVHRDL